VSAERLADLVAIETLQARYCRFVDSGYASAADDPDAFAALFADDGVWAAAGEPVVGRAAIREHAAAGRRFRFHLVANPIVDLDGDHATGRWHVLVALTSRDGEAHWLAGRYVNEYVRTRDGWRFAAVRFERAFNAPYGTGWAQ
jgi:uncharacterized protein (TIGR02246 family)